MHAVQTILLLLIATGVAYIVYLLSRESRRSGEAEGPAPTGERTAGATDAAGNASGGTDRYGLQLALYREVVRLVTRIGQDGEISKHELIDFRSRTHEAEFLFDKDVAAYVEEIYQRAVKLAGTNRALKNTRLSIGDERDAITLENSKQLIWLADQLPQLARRFSKYLSEPHAVPPSGR